MVDFWMVDGSTGAGARAGASPPAGWAIAIGETNKNNHVTLNALCMMDLAITVDAHYP
jgi:hypothetical protein